MSKLWGQKDGAGMLIWTLNWERVACCSALAVSGSPSRVLGSGLETHGGFWLIWKEGQECQGYI